MSEFTVEALNSWAINQRRDSDQGVYEFFTGTHETPWGVLEYEDEYRDYSDYNLLVRLGDRHFVVTGYYDSWNGIDYEDDELHEVEERTKVVKEWVRV